MILLIEYYLETRKVTGFVSLRANCWERNQETSKCQIGFSGKTCKGLKQKSKYHHRILNLRTSLGIKFQLKLIIF